MVLQVLLVMSRELQVHWSIGDFSTFSELPMVLKCCVKCVCRYIECQCFAGMSINFRSGEFLALRHDHFLAKVMPIFRRGFTPSSVKRICNIMEQCLSADVIF
jgi:hypothetical protein